MAWSVDTKKNLLFIFTYYYKKIINILLNICSCNESWNIILKFAKHETNGLYNTDTAKHPKLDPIVYIHPVILYSNVVEYFNP